MANHAKTQLRDYAVGLLDNLQTTGDKCEGGRPSSRPVPESELPRLLVWTNEEEVEYTSGQRPNRRMSRACQLMVMGLVMDDDLDTKLDTIAKEVEAAIEADPTFGGAVKDVYLASTTKNSDPEAKKPTGEVTLMFTIEYDTREGVPDAFLT